MNYSYIAVLSNDPYFPGLCALNYSLKKVKSKYPLSVVVPESMPRETQQSISDLNIQVIPMPDIVVDDALLAKNPEARWNTTLFKLSIFNLTQFDKLVFLDLDMIIMGNIDELFDKPHMSAVAAGKCIFPEWKQLNSGLMVIEPNREAYEGILSVCGAACEDRLSRGLGFGDQNAINYYYKDWPNQTELGLSEIYNCMSVCVKKLTAIHGFDNIKVMHFVDRVKPWQYTFRKLCVYLARSVYKREWARLKFFFIYRKYLKESCPDYKKYVK
jgi:alpha-N-acetylglucosamine transferase